MEKWTDESTEEAINLLKEGKSYSDIAIHLNKSYSSVRSKLFKFDIKFSDYGEYEKNRVKHCLECGKEIYGYKKFCDNSCAASYNNKHRIVKEIKICINCGKIILSKNAKKYCCKKCQFDYKKKILIEKWKNGETNGISSSIGDIARYIRKYIFEKYDNKCARCGWHEINPYTNKIPLQVEHIDGNYANNKEENLILLCPSCHSLTPTYGARNKGNGRPRYKKK